MSVARLRCPACSRPLLTPTRTAGPPASPPTPRWVTSTPTTSPRTPTSCARSGSRRSPGSIRSRRRPRWRASPRPRPGRWCGPIGSPTHRALPGQGVRRQRRAGSRERVHRQDRLRPRSVRGGVDREPDLLDHRQRVRVQGAGGAAAGGHADPAALRQDLPGAAARDRDGARVPGQVRAAAAGGHGQAEAGPVGQELRARGLRGPARRAGLHQGRREHQLAAVHALARSLPVLHRGRQPSGGGQRRGQGPLHERHRRDDGGDVRARRVRQGAGQRDHHDGPDRRLHRDAVDVASGRGATG